jgi:DNA-binding transcriptional LysR family regulator
MTSDHRREYGKQSVAHPPSDHATLLELFTRCRISTSTSPSVARGRATAWQRQGSCSPCRTSFLIAAMAAAQTDCIAALPDRVAELCIRLLPLKRVTATFPMPRLTTVMVWHERTDADPGARFFRQLVAEAVGRR